ncbi:MAG: type II secretion system F family protein [Thermoguttaceae bacterium]|nr:type II secretion system F family protein [Thermoguttaceae bacterium]MDW8077738.1 type II secretion system F family protein [Thermoguttaceae bacterium]
MELDPLLGSIAIGLAIAVGVFSGGEYLAQGFSWIEQDFADKLRRLRAPVRYLRGYLIGWLILVVAFFVLFAVIFENMVFAVLTAIFLLAAPWYLLRRMAERRRRRIEEQLADAMVTFTNAIRAGLSLAQALEILALRCPRPINWEFQQIVAEYNMGKPLVQTLAEAKGRLKSENFALFAAALMASHESGGRLSETVERIAQSVLELQRLERKILSETAQARKSAIYMAIIPICVLAAYWYVDPVNTSLLFRTTLGQFILGIAVVLNVIAYFWARLILNPDI